MGECIRMSMYQKSPMSQVVIEARGLLRVFMPQDENRVLVKLLTGVFVLVWAVITLGLAFESVSVVRPPFYGVFTAIVFLWVGKQWDIEVRGLLGKR